MKKLLSAVVALSIFALLCAVPLMFTGRYTWGSALLAGFVISAVALVMPYVVALFRRRKHRH